MHISKVICYMSCKQGFYTNILLRTVKFSVNEEFCTIKIFPLSYYTTTHSVSIVKTVL